MYLPWQIHMVRTWQFSQESCEYFSCFDLKTVCLKKCSFIRVIAECDYVNLLIFLTILGSLLCLRHI